ncbi:hypothetical protein Vafri_6086 [Volvox africanus]|uniref:Uncharacterized protein n=1 Tax=Volvox africanus TaxID=51714 RepID=A0A8J4AYR0_9CHLO|nr:hypothetical protein Vafri_6086 [Volvox africanus]
MLAACWAMQTLRPYLHGIPFVLVTDHAPLLWLMEGNTVGSTGTYARWALIMSQFDFNVCHRPGALHQNADALSRMPQPTSADGSGARMDEDTDPRPPGPQLVPYPTTLVTGEARCFNTVYEVALTAAASRLQRLKLAQHADNTVLPTAEELLAGHNGDITDASDLCPTEAPTETQQMQRAMLLHANRLARDHRVAVNAIACEAPRAQQLQPQLADSEPRTLSLDSSLVSRHLLDKALTEGLMVIEFGARASGLEACLRAGWRVRDYYVATELPPAAATRLTDRVRQLRLLYPQQLLARATVHPTGRLPTQEPLTEALLRGLGAHKPHQWFVVGALSSPQDPSAEHLLQLVGALQRLHPRLLPGYLVEIEGDWRHRDTFGNGFLIDRAAFGRQQHSLATIYTNLADARRLTKLFDAHLSSVPLPSLRNSLPLRRPPVTTEPLARPYWLCDVPGTIAAVLPPGDLSTISLDGPSGPSRLLPEELARVLDTPASLVTGLPEALQLRLLFSGTTTDAAAHVCAFAQALQLAYLTPHHMAVLKPRYALSPEPPSAPPPGGVWSTDATTPSPTGPREAAVSLAITATAPSLRTCTALVAEAAETLDQQPSADLTDPWADHELQHFLKYGRYSRELAQDEKRRINHRSNSYRMAGDKLLRLMPNGTIREVPQPQQRRQVIERTHNNMGHFGKRRTLGLLQTGFWWPGMSRDVATVVGTCKLCDQVNAVGNVKPEELQPLPIKGPFYRWGCDLAGPFPTTKRGNTMVMVCVEHFTKHVELAALPSKHSEQTARVLLERVLTRFSAPAEIVTDRGQEWGGTFAALCEQSLVDHRRTSPNHPQADGAAERIVQVLKRSLRKFCAAQGTAQEWDEQLPWIGMGYNCSPQASTGHSPYELLYGSKPVIPPAVRERFEQALDPGNVADFQHYLELRTKDVQRLMPEAAGNLLIAQQRDKHRYARIRGGGYKPRLSRFEAGDYVYVIERNRTNTLQVPTRENVLRVVDVTPAGVATLKGRCGTERKENVTNLKPCHLPDVDPVTDARLAVPAADLACEVCSFPDQEEVMLLCDGCGTGWHMHCVKPAIIKIPAGTWVCPECCNAGVNAANIERLPAQTAPTTRAKIFPSAAQRRWGQAAASFDGKRIRRAHKDPVTLEKSTRDGTARYLEEDEGQPAYMIYYDDGLVEKVTPGVVRRHLLKNQPAAKALVTKQEELPDQWDLTTESTVKRALTMVMPGITLADAPTAQFVRWASKAQATQQRGEQPGYKEAADAEMKILLDALDLSKCVGVLDPWTGHGHVARGLRLHGLPVLCNDASRHQGADRYEDALQPAFYRRVQDVWPYDAIITSPWPAVLDLALPLATFFAPIVAMHVPSHAVTNAHGPRREYLQKLAEEGQLALMMGMPGAGQRGLWIVVFASRALKGIMLCRGTAGKGAWVIN